MEPILNSMACHFELVHILVLLTVCTFLVRRHRLVIWVSFQTNRSVRLFRTRGAPRSLSVQCYGRLTRVPPTRGRRHKRGVVRRQGHRRVDRNAQPWSHHQISARTR